MSINTRGRLPLSRLNLDSKRELSCLEYFCGVTPTLRRSSSWIYCMIWTEKYINIVLRLVMLKICYSLTANMLGYVTNLFKWPKIYDNNNVCPKIAKHFCQHSECPLEWTSEPVFVFVDNQKRVDLLNLNKNHRKCSLIFLKTQLITDRVSVFVVRIGFHIITSSPSTFINSSTNWASSVSLNPGVSTTVTLGPVPRNLWIYR